MTKEKIMFWQDDDEGVTGWYIVYFEEDGVTNYDTIGPYDTAQEAQEFAPTAIVIERLPA